MSAIRDFCTAQLSAASGRSRAQAAGDAPTGAGDNSAAKTDDSGLSSPDTVYVSPDEGTTDEPFPKPDVEYDFCANFVNKSKLPSGPCFVKFTLTGDQNWDADFPLDDGLKAGANVLAVVHFGKFPNKYASYDLNACIYSSSDPDTPIGCAGSFGIVVNTK